MDGTARTVSYTMDVHGNHTAIGSNFGYAVGYTFDAADRMLTAIDGGGTALRASYDSAGRPSRLDSGAALTSSAILTYDALGRMATLAHDLAGATNDETFTYGYNPASQIIARTSSNDLYASNTAYAVNRSYTANGLNQYTAAGSATFTYDANGNLRTDGANTYVYDAENRLVSASGAHNATLGYDPLGRLWQVTSGASTTRFIYDGDALIWETDGAGNTRQVYLHGPNAAADDPLIWYDGNAGFARRFLHTDHQGSIIATADEAGNLVAINAYDAWGIPNATNVGRFQYTGQAWLAELGMYYYKARIYSPTLNRFMQTDPVGYADQNNLYEYVGDDPVNRTDPSGMCSTGSRVSGNDSIGCMVMDGYQDKPTQRGPRTYAPEGQRGGGQAQQPDPAGSDHHLTLSEANSHYRDGTGTPVDVDATQLSVTIDHVPTRSGQTVESTVNGWSDWVVHGSVNVTLQRDGSYRMVDGMYDFDVQRGRSLARNVGTVVAERIATHFGGGGRAFLIRYHGSPTVLVHRPPSLNSYDICVPHPGAC